MGNVDNPIYYMGELIHTNKKRTYWTDSYTTGVFENDNNRYDYCSVWHFQVKSNSKK